MAIRNTNLGGTDWVQQGLSYTDLNDTFDAMVDYVDDKALSLIETITVSETASTTATTTTTDVVSVSAQTISAQAKMLVVNYTAKTTMGNEVTGGADEYDYARLTSISSDTGTIIINSSNGRDTPYECLLDDAITRSLLGDSQEFTKTETTPSRKMIIINPTSTSITISGSFYCKHDPANTARNLSAGWGNITISTIQVYG